MSSQVIASNQSSPLYTSLLKASGEDIQRYTTGLEPMEPMSTAIYSKTTPSQSYSFGDSVLRFDMSRFGVVRGSAFVERNIHVGYDASNTLEWGYGGVNAMWKEARIETSSGRTIATLLPANCLYYASQLPPHERDTVHQLMHLYPEQDITNPGSGADRHGLRNGSGGQDGGSFKGYIWLPFACFQYKETQPDLNFWETCSIVIDMETQESNFLLNNAKSGGISISSPLLLMGYTQFSSSALKRITASQFKASSNTVFTTQEDTALAKKTIDVSGLGSTEETTSCDLEIDSNGLFTKWIITCEYIDSSGIVKGLAEILDAKITVAGSEVLPSMNPKVVSLISGSAYTSGDSTTTGLNDDVFVIPFCQSNKRINLESGISLRNLPTATLSLTLQPVATGSGDKLRVKVSGCRVKSYAVSSQSGRISTSLSV